MGIRFRCPSGHRLNVKEFLAGKRGICPKCGAKFQIPAESDSDLVKNVQSDEEVSVDPGVALGKEQIKAATERHPPTQSKSGDAALPGVSAAKIAGNANQPAVNPVGRDPVDDVGFGAELRQKADPSGLDLRIRAEPHGREVAKIPEAVGTPQVMTEGAELDRSTPAATVDPISEAPHAVWYVRPPSGGQFGPASGDIMRSWIAEGRVTIDSLVWREGWPEWQSAGSTFPGLLTPGSHAALAEVPRIVTQPSVVASTEIHRKRKSTKMTLPLVGSLIVACVILFAALIYVVQVMN